MLFIVKRFITMIENMDTVPIFISGKGVPYRLFIHNCPEKEKIAELIECGFGTVESCPAGENTIVLAAPGFPAGKNEIFSIEYIIACCSRNKKLNIKDFRLNKISEYHADFNPMDVLEGILTWSEAEKYRSGSLMAGQSSLLTSGNSGDSDDGAHIAASLHLRRERKYSLAHEKDIVECVVKHGAYDLVKGTALWKMMEEKKMCGGRTWQSMKEHFLKKILPSIESFNLTETQITRFKNSHCNNSRRPRQKRNLTSSVVQESNGMLSRIGSSSRSSNKQSSLCTEHTDGQDDQCIIRNTNYYMEAEDIAILKFVSQRKRYKATGGVRLWKLMERKKAVPGRSWQSMKERYRKVLIQKLDEYLPSDVATQMLEADLEGTKQRTKKRKAPAAPRILSLQTHTRITEPNAATSKPYSDCLRTNCTSLSGSTNTGKNSVDSYMSVSTSTPNKKKSIQNHIHSPKRKLFSQRKSPVEFTPASESGKGMQSSEYQSALTVEVHRRELNHESDDGSCSRSMRYAAVARVHKKSQHVKDITARDMGNSVVAVHNTGHTCQENAAWKSGHTDGISGSTHASCSTSSVSACVKSYSDVVLENITANADKPSPEQLTYCCSSQASMSPSSSLPPEESSHSYKEGFAAPQAATTSQCTDIRDLEQPISSEHKNTDSSDRCESSAEDFDSLAQKSVGSPGHDFCESCCSLAASTASADNSTATSGHSNTAKKMKKLMGGSKDCPVCDVSQNMEPCRQDT